MNGKARWFVRGLNFAILLVCVFLCMPQKYAQADTKVPLRTLPAGTVINFGPSDSCNYYVINGYNWIVLDPNSGYVLMQQNLERYFNGYWPGYQFEWSARFNVSYAPDNQYNIAYKLNHEFLNGAPSWSTGPRAFSAEDQAAILTHDWTTADENGQTHGYPATVNCKIGMISRDEYRYYTNNETFLGIISPQIYYFTRTPSSTGYAETFNVQGDKLTKPDLGYNTTNNAFVRPSMYLNPETLVTVVPGFGETGRSTVSCNLPAVTSDGVAASTITVTLRDTQGALLKNRTVTLAADGGHSIITPINAITDINGTAAFTVKDNTAETVTYTAADTTCAPNVRITQTATVTFLPADAGLSTVTPGTASLTAGGSQAITVTLLDSGSHPMSNKQVSLVSNSPNAAINGRQWSDSAVTDANGSAVFSVTDNIAETVAFVAMDMTDSLMLTHAASVTFTPGPASGLEWHIQPPESGTAGLTFETQPVVYLVDQYGNLVTGGSSTVVTLTASGGEALFGNTATLASGVASFSNLATTKAGTFTLTASGGGFSSAASCGITIEPAEVKKLLWHTQPPVSGTQGTALSTKPVIYLYDQFDNLAANDNSTKVALTTLDWRILGGEVSVTAVKGVATFDPVPESSGTYTLKAAAYPGIQSAPSSQVSVSPASPKLNTLKAGTVVNFAGYSWIVLDPSRGYLLMQSNLPTYRGIVNEPLYLPFDTNSNSPVFDPERETSIAYYLNNTFYNSLPSGCRSSITAFQRWGIGTNDGQGSNNENTAFTTCKIGLISYSEYEQYRSIIHSAPGGVSEYWWTRTPRPSGGAWFIFYNFPGSDYAFSNETVRQTLYLDPLLPLDGSIVGFPVPDLLSYDAAPVPYAGSGPTSATFALNNDGDTVAIRVSGGRITPPSFGDSAPAGPGVINPYVSGSSFNASDGDYVGLYEIDGSNKVVAFSQVRANVGATEARVKMFTNIYVGGYEQLTATLHLVSSGSVPVPYATWSSSDRSVATVSSTGLVKGISVGTAAITVRTIDNLTATCSVTVNPAPTNPTTVSSNWPEVPVGNDPVVINVPSNVTNASLSTTRTVSGDSASVLLPKVTTSASTAYGNVNLSIPNETQVTGPSTWDGKINLPRVVETPGIVPSGCRAVEIGAGDTTLILSQPVRIVLAGQARNNKYVGWIKNNTFNFIPFIGTNPADDNPSAAVGVPGDGYLILGNDIVIWTKHFTTFVTYAEDNSNAGSSVTPPTTGKVERIYGQDRIDTALCIAKAAFKGKVSNVILATSENYPDALAGSVLAYRLNAPVLLVGGSDNEQEKVLTYIKDNMGQSGTVYILGGKGAVGSGMEGKVIGAGYKNIKRLGGDDRYETSVKIAEAEGIVKGTPVVIVSGDNYPDALSVSSASAVNQYPIMLVSKDNIPDSVREEISRINPNKVYIIGLQGVVSQGLEDEISAVLSLDKSDIVRIGGQDRYATSLEVAKYFSMKGGIVCAATGSNFPDALAGSIYAALYDAPVILADSSLPDDAVTYLKSRNTTGAVIFGGEGAVSGDIENQLEQILR